VLDNQEIFCYFEENKKKFLTKQKPYDIIKSQGKESQRSQNKKIFKKNKKRS